jgi:alkanesulfonate monooxygenase SsuD/methylene tetrahydromethanopterin reductase-like flavin-dependent oxidoreductase (luciferase family)
VSLHFGITGGDRPWLGELARMLETLGYAAVWTNDIPGHRGVPAVAGLARGESGLRLGIGVISVADQSPASIAAEIHRSGVEPQRLILGVGSGGSRSLALVRESVAVLREELPGVRLAIAALGPRMCELAGEIADVVLLNWATPARIAWARERVAAGAARAERPVPLVAAYVRVAVGPGAAERLDAERRRYAAFGAYRRQFQAQDEIPGIAAPPAADVRAALMPYLEALDICVVRALPESDSLRSLFAVAEAARPD